MRYVLKQKWYSQDGSMNIRDERGREVYYLEGNFRGSCSRLWIYDANRAELARVESKLLAFNSTYEVYRNGTLNAVINRDFFSVFTPHFAIDIPGGEIIDVKGDFPKHEYTFSRGDKPVARVTEKWPNWTDTYGLAVAEGEDDILFLAFAAAIDCSCNFK